MNLIDWATRWNIPFEAVAELRDQMGCGLTAMVSPDDLVSEAGVIKRVQLDYAARGDILWRNNVGACVDESGRHIRYGLANVSQQMNRKVKSSDLIGITKRLITPEMVGHIIGQFTARECKRPGWKWAGSEREVAQLRYQEIVLSMGGDVAFTTGE